MPPSFLIRNLSKLDHPDESRQGFNAAPVNGQVATGESVKVLLVTILFFAAAVATGYAGTTGIVPFPSTTEFIRYYNVGLLSGPLLLTISVSLWVVIIRRRAGGQASRSLRPWLVPFAIAALGIGLVHFVGVYASVLNAFHARFEPSDLAEVRIERIMSEDGPAVGPPILFSPRNILMDGFARLSSATSRPRNHEDFSDGYRIQIRLQRESYFSNRYISVFRKTNGDHPATVVVPHIGPDSLGSVNNAGEYSCPAFVAWVHDYLDPLFPDRPFLPDGRRREK